MKTPQHPRVVIVGRPNVGKSSLLNALAGRRVSIVDPTAGVTRDRISAYVTISGPFGARPPALEAELIDTGGYGIEDTQARELSAHVERQIAFGVAEADVILFLLDAKAGVVPLDEEIARLLRDGSGLGAKGGLDPRRLMLVANKVDGDKQEAHAYEAASLGLGNPHMVSAVTKRGLSDLSEKIYERLIESVAQPVTAELEPGAKPQATHEDEAEDLEAEPEDLEHATDPSNPLLAIVGKRNAGKSTLVNALAGSERVIVSEIEGTTRDSVDVRFQMGDQSFTAIDTAGVRKRKSVKDDVEFYSYHRSLRSIRRADVVALLIDATVPISQVDTQLGNEVLKHYKPTMVVINKWDLVESDHTQEEYLEYLDANLKGLNFAPVAFISARRGEGMQEVAAMAMNLYHQAGHRMGTGELNRLVERILAERGPISKGGKLAKLFYCTQLAVRPPTLGLFVNDPELIDANYERFLLNRLRDEVPFSEVPIKLVVRPRRHAPKQPG